MKQYKYFGTLGEAFKLALKNKKIFVPYLIYFALMLLMAPMFNNLNDPFYLQANLAKVILFFIGLIIIGFLFAGWIASVLNQLITKKKVDLGSSFKRLISFSLRTLGIAIIGLLMLIIPYILLSLLILLSVMVGAPIIGLVFGLAFIVFVVLFISAFMQTWPVLLVEDTGVIDTVRKAVKFYFKKKLFSFLIFLVTALVMLVLSIPAIIYNLKIAMQQFEQILAGEPLVYTLSQTVILDFLYLPAILGMVVIFVYYCLSYIKKKDTIK